MKINSPGLEHYQSYVKSVKNNGENSAAKAKGKGAASASNTDKVTISASAAQRAETSRLAAALSSEVEGAASPERMEALRAAVQDGSYQVAAEDVADAILDRLV